MGHSHDHHRTQNRRALRWALALTATYTVVEVVGGILTDSLALLADAAHMLSDNVSIGLALFAIWLASKPATPDKSFGYRRAEILAALANGVTLVALSIWIFVEAARRFSDPQDVLGGWMLGIAVVGLGVNVGAVLILSRGRTDSLNVEAAFRHVLADLLGSVGVIAAGIVIVTTGWQRADPTVSVIIGLLVLASSWTILRDATRILLEAAPAGLDAAEVGRRLSEHPGVHNVHDLHVWTITSGFPALSAHVLVGPKEDCHMRRAELEALLHEEFGIDHTTLQVDHARAETIDVSQLVVGREHELRQALAEHFETREGELQRDQELSQRAVELDARTSKLATTDADLEERERRLSEELAELREAQARLTKGEAELAREQDLNAERSEQLESEKRHLKEGDKAREKAATELKKRAGTVADREEKLSRKEQSIATHESEVKGRLESRERLVDDREQELKKREKATSLSEQKIDGREHELTELQTRLQARDDALDERESELETRSGRLRADAQRLEAELAEQGKAAKDAIAKLTELDRRDHHSAAREAALERREQAVGKIEQDVTLCRELSDLKSRLEGMEHELAEREADVANTEALTSSQKQSLERREKRLLELEETLRERLRELDDREIQVDSRDAGSEAEVEIRLEKLERREAEITDLEARLAKKETELAQYVAQVQGAMNRPNSEWRKTLTGDENPAELADALNKGAA